MTTPQHQLLAVLRRILSRNPTPSDFRKASNGRVIRFIDWRKAERCRSGRRL